MPLRMSHDASRPAPIRTVAPTPAPGTRRHTPLLRDSTPRSEASSGSTRPVGTGDPQLGPMDTPDDGAALLVRAEASGRLVGGRTVAT